MRVTCLRQARRYASFRSTGLRTKASRSRSATPRARRRSAARVREGLMDAIGDLAGSLSGERIRNDPIGREVSFSHRSFNTPRRSSKSFPFRPRSMTRFDRTGFVSKRKPVEAAWSWRLLERDRGSPAAGSPALFTDRVGPAGVIHRTVLAAVEVLRLSPSFGKRGNASATDGIDEDLQRRAQQLFFSPRRKEKFSRIGVGDETRLGSRR